MTYFSPFLVEITIGVVVGVLVDVGVGVDRLDPVQEDHQPTGGKTLKQTFVKNFKEDENLLRVVDACRPPQLN